MGRGTSNVLYGPTNPRGAGEAVAVEETTNLQPLSPVILEVSGQEDIIELDVSLILQKMSDTEIEDLYAGQLGQGRYSNLLGKVLQSGLTDPLSKLGSPTAQDVVDSDPEHHMVLDGADLTNYIREQRPKLAGELELTKWS